MMMRDTGFGINDQVDKCDRKHQSDARPGGRFKLEVAQPRPAFPAEGALNVGQRRRSGPIYAAASFAASVRNVQT